MTTGILPPRISVEWLEFIMSQNVVIKYKPGPVNYLADMLSRSVMFEEKPKSLAIDDDDKALLEDKFKTQVSEVDPPLKADDHLIPIGVTPNLDALDTDAHEPLRDGAGGLVKGDSWVTSEDLLAVNENLEIPKPIYASTPCTETPNVPFSPPPIIAQPTIDDPPPGDLPGIDGIRECERVLFLDASNLDIKTCQRADHWSGPIVSYLEEGILPQEAKAKKVILATSDQYLLDKESGLLFRLFVPSKHRGSTTYTQLCIPKVLEKKLLELYHDHPLWGGHFGVARTYHKIVKGYFMPGLYQKIMDHIQTCIKCQKSRVLRHPQLPLIQPIVAQYPFQCIGTDFIGPLASSKPNLLNPRSKKYVLVMVCYFTKYVTAVATRDCTAETTIKKFFKHIVLRWGCIPRLVSDRGANYISNLHNERQEY
jgi:hypothetical protein